MALKRVTFTLTTVGVPTPGFGVATGSAHLSVPASPVRPIFLDAIAIDDTAAVGSVLSLDLFEGRDLLEDGTITEGQQLFHIDEVQSYTTVPVAVSQFAATGVPTAGLDAGGDTVAGSVPMIFPRTSAGVVDEGGSPVSAFVRIPIREENLVATILGGAQGDVFTVYVYYETAGDWRF